MTKENKTIYDKLKSCKDMVIDVIWPVHSNEIKKFLPLSMLLMLIIFVYTMLRATKDAALIPILGAEMISTVKLWGVLPFAIIFMLVYTKLSSILSSERLFYTMLAAFVGFFACYGYVLYPMQAELHFDLGTLKEVTPAFLRFPLIMIENWTISLFYIMSELWGSVLLSLLFWQFANQITPVEQAKRFYSLFGLLGQLGMIASGEIAQYVARMHKLSTGEADVWGVTLKWLMITVVAAGLVIGAIYWWMNRYVLTDINHYNPELINKNKGKKKVKLSMSESFKLIFTSKYLGMIAALVLCYGISINLVEGVWKNQVKILYPERVDYLAFMGQFQGWTAYMTMLAMIIGGNLIRRVSWFAGAIITPLMVLITGVLFFIFILMRTELEPTLAIIGTTALMMSVLLGATQNILSKSIKYSAFDATKEMAYIPLDDDLKAKGKAAVDVVGGRLGKSGGAVIQQVLLAFICPSIACLTSEIFIIFVIMMFVWMYSVSNLSKAFEKESK